MVTVRLLPFGMRDSGYGMQDHESRITSKSKSEIDSSFTVHYCSRRASHPRCNE
jgi:hypothetical protein